MKKPATRWRIATVPGWNQQAKLDVSRLLAMFWDRWIDIVAAASAMMTTGCLEFKGVGNVQFAPANENGKFSQHLTNTFDNFDGYSEDQRSWEVAVSSRSANARVVKE